MKCMRDREVRTLYVGPLSQVTTKLSGNAGMIGKKEHRLRCVSLLHTGPKAPTTFGGWAGIPHRDANFSKITKIE